MFLSYLSRAMYNTRNTGTGDMMRGIRGTREIGGMLYSGECGEKFRRLLSNIPGLPNIPGNVLDKPREYSKIIWGML